MFDPDTSLDLLNGSDLLTELGVDRHTVRELAEDERPAGISLPGSPMDREGE